MLNKNKLYTYLKESTLTLIKSRKSCSILKDGTTPCIMKIQVTVFFFFYQLFDPSILQYPKIEMSQ